eukprot:CAMPEP_0202720894 /NCGR_PEP_ID=MMETSP1385-20130828/144081_1 /ASSEMBLY_ACC=CAM_ASM_000861 /TAXON_ID=933848 /ORGANISM="Elphidium margaritaceum" /LENGTH=41 /DNA_ID= /DNA_START= /DNA_END= /DNA_ORIENTATION=
MAPHSAVDLASNKVHDAVSRAVLNSTPDDSMLRVSICALPP